MSNTILTLPGLNNSGERHWQTLWEEKLPHVVRVQQREWDTPTRSEWTAAHGTKVVGALLVAPADVERPGFPQNVVGFAPVPRVRLPFRSIVVASSDDPWCALPTAKLLAEDWGARFHEIGACGHLNAASDLGDWPQGRDFLSELVKQN